MASLDFGVPAGAAYRPGGCGHAPACRRWARLAGPGWVETGHFLGPSIERFWHATRWTSCWDVARGRHRRIRVQRLSVGGGIIIHGIKT